MNLWYGVLAMSYFFLYTELLIFSFEIIFMTGLKKLLNNLSSFLYKSLIALSCFLFGLDLVKNSFFFSQYLTICQLINSEPPSLSSPNSQNGNSFLISSTALTVSISIYPTVAVSQSVIRIGIDVLSNDPCLVVPRFLFNFLICRSLSNRLSRVRALIVFIFSLISSVIVISPKESIDSSIGIKEGLSLVPQG